MKKRNISKDNAGVSAVEFAITFPLFLALIFGACVYGMYFAVLISLEQLTAESARASIGGLTDAERSQIARSYISSQASMYPLLDASKLTVSAGWSSDNASVYVVSADYDMSSSAIFSFGSLVPLPPRSTTASASIQRGGY